MGQVTGRLAAVVALSVALHATAFTAAWIVGRAPAGAKDPSVALSGATLAAPALDDEAPPVDVEGASTDTSASATESSPIARTAPTKGREGRPAAAAGARGVATKAGAPSAPNGDHGASTAPALYGAVSDRSATDLASTFTRAFPQAASTDPAWASAPLGDAGSASVVLVLDDDGRLESSRIEGAPSPALRGGITRTLHLVKGRVFVAHGKTTALQLTARVSPDEVHDGLHGDVFAVGASVTGATGSAFFALSIGRRVDLSVKAR